jgi:hypothetical protein
MGPEPCRVVGAPLAVDPSPGDTWAWSTLQNVGDTPALPTALQIGWSGNAMLSEAVLERSGGSRVHLFAGDVKSPALVPLLSGGDDAEAALGPGETARFGVRFEPGPQGAAFALGSAVLFLDEGCRLALGPEHASECTLALTGVRTSGNDPKRVVLSATNRGPTPLLLDALDVHWPVGTNGALKTLYVGGRLRHEFDKGLRHSPAAIDLRKLLDKPIELASGEPTSLWLAFENPVAERPYVVTVAARDGCLATATTWLSAPGCGVGADGFSTQGRRAQLLLSNVLPVPQTLEALDVFWPDGANGPLVAAHFNGREVWRGRSERSPASLQLKKSASLNGHGSATLELVFDPAKPFDATPESGGESSSAVASTDYTIVASLRGGCRLVFSTVRPDRPVGCSVSAGELSVRPDESVAAVNLTNTGAPATLRRLAVSWPARNGALTSLSLGSLALFRGRQPPGTEPFALAFDMADGVVLDSHVALPLVLGFERLASKSGYALSLSFNSADGEPCADLLITQPRREVECALAVTHLEAEGERNIQLWVRNDGSSEVELQYLSVVWPAGEGLNQLVSVFMIDDDLEFMLWTGNLRRSPALVPLTGERAAIIEPGETIRLRMHFIQLVGMRDPTKELKLTVGTAEGCLAFYPSDDRAARPDTESFNGIVVDLPERTWGEWIVQVGVGAERQLRLVLVDEKTRFEPPTVSPEPGDIVRVEAVAYDDDGTAKWRALRIAFHSSHQRVKHLGRIVDLDRANPDSSRPAWIRIYGFPGLVRIVDATRVDGDLRLGTRVEVEGTLGSNGSITAIFVKVRETPSDQLVTVRGVVQNSERADEVRAGLQLWYVSKYRVEVDTAAVESDLVPHDRLPSKGERVEVRGRLTGNRIIASRVAEAAEPRTSSVQGTIVSLPPGGVLGTWIVRRVSGGELSMLVESASVVDARSAPALPGMFVSAVVQEIDGGRRVVLGVRVDWPD